MSSPDLINAAFEALGTVFVGLNVLRLYRDKMVRGVDWRVMGFFTAWGLWNIFYYPHLGQWLSFVAGLGIAAANVVYVTMLLYYIRKENRNDNCD